MIRKLAILTLLTALLVIPTDAGAKDKPRNREGSYNVLVGGFLKGSGNGTVSGASIKIQASVVTTTGVKGELSADNITINGTHFSGTGTFQGKPAIFQGRIDAPDDEFERSLKGVRLVSTVKTGDGKYSRLIGYIPALAKAKDANDEDDDRDRGRGKH